MSVFEFPATCGVERAYIVAAVHIHGQGSTFRGGGLTKIVDSIFNAQFIRSGFPKDFGGLFENLFTRKNKNITRTTHS
jgi:hypothetical protein